MAGTGPFGYRLAGVIAGSLTILVVARTAGIWRGITAARIAAILIAFNEYHIGVSALATEKVFNLLFSAMAILAFIRFLRTQRAGYLFLTAGTCGLAVLTKETGFLLVAALGIGLLVTPQRKWLGRRQTWAALALLVAIVLPDFVGAMLARADGNVTYDDHLRRIGGIGFTPYYLSFYLRQIAARVYALLGGNFMDYAEEYPSMSVLNGVILLGAAVATVATVFRRRQSEGDRNIHLIVFWGVLLFFMSVRPSWETRLNPIVWFWVDVTLLPAVVLAAAVGASAWSSMRIPLILALGLTAGYAGFLTIAERLNLPAGPKVGLYPSNLPLADGTLIELHATILKCATCRLDRAELADIQIRQPDGTWISAIGSPLVADAQPGTADRDFRVAAATPTQARRYRVVYNVTSRGGVVAGLSQEIRPLRPGQNRPPVRPWTVPERSVIGVPPVSGPDAGR